MGRLDSTPVLSSGGMNLDTDAVILAGGYSKRAKTFKMELELEGKPVLQHVINVFLPLCTHVIVVGGYQFERLYPLVEAYEDKVSVVFNADYPKGMFTSIKKGIAEVTGSRFFLTPGDYPLLTLNTCRRLLEYGEQIVKPVYRGRGGHPILLPSRCIKEILEEDDGSSLRNYLDKQQVIRVVTEDEGILYDIDTLTDYEKVRQLMKIKYQE